MTTFQLDQNLQDRKFAADCESTKTAAVWRFPKKLLGAPDEEVLLAFMATDRPMVTMDREIASAHPHSIPDRNPGIVVVGFALGHVKSLTIKDVRAILAKFKESFPKWTETSIAGSIVEITQNSVEVWHVEQHKLIRDDYFAFATPHWQDALAQLLDRNSRRCQRCLPG